VYEMQTSENTELRDKYLNQARSLLPCATNADEWAHEVEKIRCFSLPSILESLQHGFIGRKGKGSAPQELAPKIPTTLSEGFPEQAKYARFESIRHQHRMHWSISKFPRNEFYGTEGGMNQQRLLDADQTLEARSDFGFLLKQSNRNLNVQERRYWVDVSNGAEIAIIGNPQEAKKVSEILDDLIHWFEGEETDRSTLSIALLTPYVNQSRTIRKEANIVLQKRKVSIKGTRCNMRLIDNRNVTIFCSTVDKFQGQEADVVILSLRNVHRQGNIDSPNRANVALTRAREALFIVGNRTNYKNARDPMLKRLATGVEMVDENTYWRMKK
jgi:superfamily I DNA and/or RNA helicase